MRKHGIAWLLAALFLLTACGSPNANQTEADTAPSAAPTIFASQEAAAEEAELSPEPAPAQSGEPEAVLTSEPSALSRPLPLLKKREGSLRIKRAGTEDGEVPAGLAIQMRKDSDPENLSIHAWSDPWIEGAGQPGYFVL